MAALALGASFFKDTQTAILGALAMLALMVLLLVFAAAATQGATALRLPALFLTWTFTVLFIVSATLTVSAVFFDTPKPFPVLIRQLRGDTSNQQAHNASTPASPTFSAQSFEVHAYALGDRVQPVTSDRTDMRDSESINVGCEQDGQARVSYDIPSNATVSMHSAQWINIDNIKSHTAQSVISGSQLVATGSLRGRDKELFNCPGGGHATLRLNFTLRQSSDTVTAAPPLEIGASELQSLPITFESPADNSFRLNTYRIDVRPLHSQQPFASMELSGCLEGSREAARTFFSESFQATCNGRTLIVKRAAKT
jgi:hypothetical protein